MDVFWICLTVMLSVCCVCVTWLLRVLAEADVERSDIELRRMKERAERAEQVEKDSRQAISCLCGEVNRLKKILKNKGYEKESDQQ